MAQSVAAPHKRGFLSTLRTDAWWFEPVLVAISLSIFFGWLTISIFLDGVGHYEIGPYITPVFEPLFSGLKSDSIFLSPGMVVLLGPVPLAIDFGFPLKQVAGDKKQVFSFWIGVFGQ